MPPGYSRVSDEDEDGPFRSGQEVSSVVGTSRGLEMSFRSSFRFRIERVSSISFEFLERVISAYVTVNTRWYAALLVWFFILALSVGTTVYSWKRYPPQVDITLGSFKVPDQQVSREYDALQLAIEWGKKKHSLRTRTTRSSACCFGERQGCHAWKFDIVYLPIGGGEDPDNIFTEERISDIHSIETKIRQDPQYEDFCWKNNQKCIPINSLLTYFYPSKENGHLVFNGLGNSQEVVNDALDKAATHRSTYWYVDGQFSKNNKKSRLLRSEVTLGRPLPDFPLGCISGSEREEESSKAADYMVSLIPLLEKASTKKVKVLFGGGSIYDYQVKQAVQHDSKYAIISLCLVVVLVFFLTSMSSYLTIMGILCVAESFPFTYIIYRTWFDIHAIGILNIISLFVIVGIGVDDVFVFINTFRLAHQHENDVHARLVYTIKTAGITTLFTSVTTATAFFANVPSQLPAIHDFGLFMGVLVVVCYLITVLSMPAVLYIWWLSGTTQSPLIARVLIFGFNNPFVQRQSRQSMGQETHVVASNYEYTIPMDVMPMDIMNGYGPPVDASSNGHVEEDDLPLQLGDSSTDFDETSDSMLLRQQIAETVKCTDATNHDLVRQHENSLSLFSYLQNFISKYLSKWVVRFRIILFILYIIALHVSLGLVSNIRPANKPPQFFPSDSNIQQLIDISYNLTDSDKSHCWDCSGFFTQPDIQLPTMTPTHPRLTNHPITYPVTTELPTTTTETRKQVVATTSILTTEIHTVAVTHNTRVTTKPATHKQPTQKAKPPQVPVTANHHHSPQSKQPVKHPKTDSPVNHPKTKSPVAHPVTSQHHAQSTFTPIKLCPLKSSCTAADRPASGNNAIVFVVFGIKDIDRNQVATTGHVISDDFGDYDQVDWDEQFQGMLRITSSYKLMMDNNDDSLLRALCDICVQAQDPRRELVVSSGADCVPSVFSDLEKYCDAKKSVNYTVQFQSTGSLTKQLLSQVAFNTTSTGTYVKWLSMAFLSTTYKGKSSFDNVKNYNKWNDFLKEMKRKHSDVSAIQKAYQTSSYWVDMFRETTTVSSAISGIVLSIVLCMGWVMIFTGHIWLLVVVFMSIAGTLLTVLALIYVIGWKFGAVEAITLSVLVGTSVDYIVHLVESFLLSAKGLRVRDSNPNRDVQNRVRWGIGHIGISIFSSALTTVVASIPLCFTEIQLFAKFGQILLLNTGMSIIYALTACAAMLAIFAGLKRCRLRTFQYSSKYFLLGLLVVLVVYGCVVLSLYIAYRSGENIPGPKGHPLF